MASANIDKEIQDVQSSYPVPKNSYKDFTLHQITYSIGNFVIINGEYEDEIAKIFYIFFDKNVQQLIVRKYIFARDMKNILMQNGCRRFDEDNEVVEDLTKDYVIQADQILKRVYVIFAEESEDFAVIKNNSLDSSTHFFCRYSLKSNGLVPIVSTLSRRKNSSSLENSPLKISCRKKLEKSDNNCIHAMGKTTQINVCKNTISIDDSPPFSPDHRLSVKRNLNKSFGACSSDTNNSILNYSIVSSDDEKENPFILKLRISENNKKPVIVIKKLEGNCLGKYQERDLTPIRKSNRKVIRKSYADYISPIKTTPKKRSNLTGANESKRSPRRSNINNKEAIDCENSQERLKSDKESNNLTGESPVRRSFRLTHTPQSNRRLKREKSVPSDTDVTLKCVNEKTPRKRVDLDGSIRRSILKMNLKKEDVEEDKNKYESNSDDFSCSEENYDTKRQATTPRTKRKGSRSSMVARMPRSSTKQTPKEKNRARLIREGVITPSMQSRSKVTVGDSTPLMKARNQLHVSYIPNALPCREKEYCDIFNFLEGKLLDSCGGCMYISGVPGTGKTATVTCVISNLQQSDDIPKFNYVSINGMRLTEPRQSYVEILKQLNGKTVPWEQAQTILEQKFTSSRNMPPTVILIDELDILCTKRQDVVYNLLDLPTKAKNQLIVITIANTMDLPERLLMSRVTSRLGLTRLTFQAYTHKQLLEIVTKRLSGTECFNPDAIQLVARKVASVSGDARRALDICRRAAEIAESESAKQLVNMCHVNEALNAMITQPKVRAIKNCSKLEQLILQSIVAEVERTGVEETTFSDVIKMLVSCAAMEGFKMVSNTTVFSAVSRLSACRLILSDTKCNDISQKLILNVSVDDVYYALKKAQY